MRPCRGEMWTAYNRANNPFIRVYNYECWIVHAVIALLSKQVHPLVLLVTDFRCILMVSLFGWYKRPCADLFLICFLPSPCPSCRTNNSSNISKSWCHICAASGLARMCDDAKSMLLSAWPHVRPALKLLLISWPTVMLEPTMNFHKDTSFLQKPHCLHFMI